MKISPHSIPIVRKFIKLFSDFSYKELRDRLDDLKRYIKNYYRKNDLYDLGERFFTRYSYNLNLDNRKWLYNRRVWKVL